MRILLAELAERVDVRVLFWKGAPIPAFRPSRGDVREMERTLARHTKIQTARDSCTGASHCHHEKTIVIDDRIAYVGGIDLTLDGGDPFDTPNHRARGGIGWHDVAVRIEGPAVRDVAEHFRLRWSAATRRALPPPKQPEPAGDVNGAGRADRARRHLQGAAQGRLLDPRVLRRCPSLGRADRVSREPVPLVARGRRHPRRQARRIHRPTTSGWSSCFRRERTTAPTSRAARSRR